MGSPPNKLTLEQWKDRVYSVNPHMHILNETLPQGTKEDPFICHCDDCGATFPSTKSAIFTAYGSRKRGEKNSKWCPVCCNQLCIAGINDVATTNPEIVKYLANPDDSKKYTVASTKQVLCKCPDCGHKRMRKVQYLTLEGFSCEMCSDNISYPNKVCRLLLKELPVDESEPEYIREWTKGKKYDGYFKLNNEKYLLEFDGKQHFQNSSWSSAEKQIANDKFKTDLAKINGFILIRINCFDSSFENIKKQIYKSILYNLFDLDKINWEKIFSMSLKNQYLDVIDFYNNNDYPSSTEILKKFDMDRHTLYRYLKRADAAGLIEYRPDIVKKREADYRKNDQRTRSENAFYVYSMFNELIGEFALQTDCVEYFKSQLNINITVNIIRKRLLTGRDYLGYTFVYKNNNIDRYQNSEIIKKVCNYFIYNQDKSNIEIGNQFNISNSTVGIYIAIGIHTGFIDINKLQINAFYKQRLKSM